MKKNIPSIALLTMGIIGSSTVLYADDQETSPITYIKNLPDSKIIAVNSKGETLIADKLAKTWKNFGSSYGSDVSQGEIQTIYQPASLIQNNSPLIKILQTNGYTSTFNINLGAYSTNLSDGNEAYWYEENDGKPALSVSSPFYKGSNDIADYVNFYGTPKGQLYARYLMKANNNSFFYGLDPVTTAAFDSPIVKMIYDYNSIDQKPTFAKDGDFDFPKSLYILLQSGALIKVNIPQELDDNGLNYFSKYDSASPGTKAKGLTRKTVADGVSTLEPQDLAVFGSNNSSIQGVIESAKGQIRFYDDKSSSNTIVNLPVKADETDYSNIITENDGTNDVARYILQDVTQSNDIYLYDVSSCSSYSFGSISSCLSKPLDHKGFNDNYSTALDSVISNPSGDRYIVVGFESGAVRYYNTTSGNWNTIQDDIYSSPVVNLTKIDNNSIYISLENGLVEQYDFDTNNIDIIRQAASTLVFNSSNPTVTYNSISIKNFSAKTADGKDTEITYNYELYSNSNSSKPVQIGTQTVASNMGFNIDFNNLKSSHSYKLVITASADGYKDITKTINTIETTAEHALDIYNINVDSSYTNANVNVIAYPKDAVPSAVDIDYGYTITNTDTGEVVKSGIEDNSPFTIDDLEANTKYTLTVTAKADGYDDVVKEVLFTTEGYEMVWVNKGAIWELTPTKVRLGFATTLDPNDPNDMPIEAVEHEVLMNTTDKSNQYVVYDGERKTTFDDLTPGNQYRMYYTKDMKNYKQAKVEFTFNTPVE